MWVSDFHGHFLGTAMMRKNVSEVIGTRSRRVGTEKETALRPATRCVVEQLEIRQLLSVSQHEPLAPALLADAHLAQPGYHVPLSIQQSNALAATVVNIPDTNLQAAIRSELGKATGAITDADMQSLTHLDASGRDISNLSGLEYATNLTTLDLYFDPVSDILPLSGLTQLQTLDLCGNQISDLSALSGLTQMRYLYLD